MKSVKVGIILSAIILSSGSALAACPEGYIIASTEDARANVNAACATLNRWDIARLQGGGSMDGPSYGCKIHDSDERPLKNVLCKKATSFQVVHGDGNCGNGLTLVDPITAIHYGQEVCHSLGRWTIARLSNGGSMDGPGYLCGVHVSDPRSLGDTLCANYTFKEGDSTL